VTEPGDILEGATGLIVPGDNLPILRGLPDGSIDLVYVDPPFNTGRRQTLRRLRTIRDEEGGDRTGFGGRRYRSIPLGSQSYVDVHDDYLDFLDPGRSTCTSTTARSTTPRFCATRSSAGRAFSTRSSGPTTTARERSGAGRPNTTTSSCT
jgi:hypothetical protein